MSLKFFCALILSLSRAFKAIDHCDHLTLRRDIDAQTGNPDYYSKIREFHGRLLSAVKICWRTPKRHKLASNHVNSSIVCEYYMWAPGGQRRLCNRSINNEKNHATDNSTTWECHSDQIWQATWPRWCNQLCQILASSVQGFCFDDKQKIAFSYS